MESWIFILFTLHTWNINHDVGSPEVQPTTGEQPSIDETGLDLTHTLITALPDIALCIVYHKGLLGESA